VSAGPPRLKTGSMQNDALVQNTITALPAAQWFDQAAEAALGGMLSAIAEALAELHPEGRGRVLRAMIHLRPNDSYRRVWVVEQDASPARAAAIEGAYVPSATAWRLVTEHGTGLSIDVQLGTLRPWLPGGAKEIADAAAPGGFDSAETRDRLRERDATHVHVVPLRLPGGVLVGMVSFEARCPSAFAEVLFPACHARLQLLSDLAAPYLAELPARSSPEPRLDDLLPVIGRSTAELVDLLRVFAQQDETLVIAGPTGVGKSRLARWCHAQSRRNARAFETLDLLSVPEELQMAELFGWRRGAFTGAVKDTAGAIARADGGTLFVDEIDKLSRNAQAGLLRVLEERLYRPLGDAAGDRRANVRFIIGTNQNLLESVRLGRFREDLYYRINVLPVRVPALAERCDEIPQWVSYMLARRHREGDGQGEAQIAADAVLLFTAAPWPGNLRQLDNIVRRAYAMALVESRGKSGALVLERRHAERALAYESDAGALPLVEHLRRAARAFVIEAERLRGSGAPLSLDLADAFRGLILHAAVEKLGSSEDAFRLLGQEGLVKGRNHHKVLRRELEKVAELCRAVGEKPVELPGDPPPAG